MRFGFYRELVVFLALYNFRKDVTIPKECVLFVYFYLPLSISKKPKHYYTYFTYINTSVCVSNFAAEYETAQFEAIGNPKRFH